jgi:hypothetical protein
MSPSSLQGHRVAIVVAALLLASPCAAQRTQAAPSSPAADSLRAAIAARRGEISRAAAIFLDPRRPVEERERAAESVTAFVEPAHVAGAAQVARDPRENPRLRALAHARIRHAVSRDSALALEAARWVRSRETPRELRLAALTSLESLLFSFTPHTFHETLLDAVRAVTEEDDGELRLRAFSILAAQGDAASLARLRQELRSTGASALPPRESVRLLGLRLEPESLPVLHAVMLDPPDAAARVEAVRLLGGYAPSRDALVRILRDPGENVEVRLAAMGALHANAPERFAAWALPVVADEGADDRLRVFAIQAVRYRRPAALRLASDDFDATVLRLHSESSSAAVRRAALDYVRHRTP